VQLSRRLRPLQPGRRELHRRSAVGLILSPVLLPLLAVILLLAPAAYHRIVERGETTEHRHQFASGMILAATIPLALGICGDFFVVLRKVLRS